MARLLQKNPSYAQALVMDKVFYRKLIKFMILQANPKAEDTISQVELEIVGESAAEPEVGTAAKSKKQDDGLSEVQIRTSWTLFWETNSSAETQASEVEPTATESNIVTSAETESNMVAIPLVETNTATEPISSIMIGSVGSLIEFKQIIANIHYSTMFNVLEHLITKLSTNFDQYASVGIFPFFAFSIFNINVGRLYILAGADV